MELGRAVCLRPEFHRRPILRVSGCDGNREDISFSIAGASQINLYSISGGPDGAIAVSGSALSADARGASFIALISSDRKKQTIIRVWPYAVQRVAIAADGVIWTAGFLKDEANTRDVAYNIIRRYDSSGKMLSSAHVPARSQWGSAREAAAGSY